MGLVIKNFMQTTQRITLSRELVSLVHFVELNESGWVRKTLASIILSELRTASPTALTLRTLAVALSAAAYHQFNNDEIADAVQYLVSQQQVIEIHRGEFKIRDSALREIDGAIALTVKEDDATEARFAEILGQNAIGLDGLSLWPHFLDLYLLPLIQEAGASTLNLISGGEGFGSRESLLPFLEIIDAKCRDEVAHAVKKFLDPSVLETRQFILKRVAAAFFVAAMGLDKKTIKALEGKRKKESHLRLFLDTNTLFSVLSLHDNDGDDGVEGIVTLNRNPQASVKIKLFVFPETIVEATSVLANAAASFGSSNYPRSLAVAGLRANVSGVRGKYLAAAARSTVPLSPKTYFAPYIDGLPAILKARGIEIIDRGLLISRTDQTIVDDVLGMVEWEQKNVSEDRRKGYEAIMHDVYVWHCVNRLRPAGIDSPLDAQEWFITLDRRLLGFDNYKRKGAANWVPTCVAPATFVQYSQFWTPRTPEFERALFGSLRLPLLFRDFDGETEDVTLAILQKLSRFETVGDFSTDELQMLLLNNAVRTRFGAAKSDMEQQNVIRDQLLEIHAETAANAKKLANSLQESDTERHQLRLELDAAQLRTVSIQEQHQIDQEHARGVAHEDSGRIAALTEEVKQHQIKLDKIEEKATQRRAVNRFCFMFFVLPILAGIGAVLVIKLWFTLVFAVSIGSAIAIVLSGYLVSKFSAANENIQRIKWLRILTTCVRRIWVPIAAFALVTASAVYQNILQDKQPAMIVDAQKLINEQKINDALSRVVPPNVAK